MWWEDPATFIFVSLIIVIGGYLLLRLVKMLLRM